MIIYDINHVQASKIHGDELLCCKSYDSNQLTEHSLRIALNPHRKPILDL